MADHADWAQRGTMLITKESSSRLAEQQRLTTADLAHQVASVLRELQAVRTEVRQLLAQRRQLEAYLTGLRSELEQLRAEKVELLAQRVVAPPSPPAHVDLVARRSGPVSAAAPAPASGVARPEDQSITPRSEDDEDAFRAFLLADNDHDKSRVWFLSNSG